MWLLFFSVYLHKCVCVCVCVCVREIILHGVKLCLRVCVGVGTYSRVFVVLVLAGRSTNQVIRGGKSAYFVFVFKPFVYVCRCRVSEPLSHREVWFPSGLWVTERKSEDSRKTKK